MVLHLVDPNGNGGIHQHTMVVADTLARAGETVVVHTTRSTETPRVDGVVVRGRFDWHADTTPRPVRIVRVIGSWLAAWAGVLTAVRSGDVVHYQGSLGAVAVPMLAAAVRARGGRFVFSPHNTFVRSGRSDTTLRWAVRSADTVVVYVPGDVEVMHSWGADQAVASPLVMPQFTASADVLQRVRAEWGPGGYTVAAPGQIRDDKGLDVLVAALGQLNGTEAGPWRLALAGKPVGDTLDRLQHQADQVGVPVHAHVGYVSESTFAAVVAAADVVACPYRRGSQSGVLRVARQAGVPTVASDVGGLAADADWVVPVDDPDRLAAALTEAARAGRGDVGDDVRDRELAELAAAHRRAYRL